jgi:hypothetical protein
MIEVQLGKKTVTINSTLTVEQYQAIQLNKLFLDNKNSTKLLALYLGIEEKELKNAKKEQVQFIEGIVFKKLTENVTGEIVFTFDYEGITYGFENDWKKLAWGAWQDIEFLCADDITKNINKLLAVLYRPVTEMKDTKYKIEPYNSDTVEERAELFKKIPIKIWFGCAQVFFYIGNAYISNIKNTLESQMKMYRLMEKGTKIIPKWLHKKLQLDSILQRQLNSAETILQNLSK